MAEFWIAVSLNLFATLTIIGGPHKKEEPRAAPILLNNKRWLKILFFNRLFCFIEVRTGSAEIKTAPFFYFLFYGEPKGSVRKITLTPFL